VGCNRCAGTGYRGRQAVFEVMEITEPVRRLIGTRADDAEIEAEACRGGMSTMIEDGLAKCRTGMTSIEEILRVTASR
jgi:general secretion pathway protein E